jgi:N-acetylneuraminic acid mutarotase
MKTARHGHKAASIKDRYIYVFGGKSQGKELTDIERYDYNQRTWTVLDLQLNMQIRTLHHSTDDDETIYFKCLQTAGGIDG